MFKYLYLLYMLLVLGTGTVMDMDLLITETLILAERSMQSSQRAQREQREHGGGGGGTERSVTPSLPRRGTPPRARLVSFLPNASLGPLSFAPLHAQFRPYLTRFRSTFMRISSYIVSTSSYLVCVPFGLSFGFSMAE